MDQIGQSISDFLSSSTVSAAVKLAVLVLLGLGSFALYFLKSKKTKAQARKDEAQIAQQDNVNSTIQNGQMNQQVGIDSKESDDFLRKKP